MSYESLPAKYWEHKFCGLDYVKIDSNYELKITGYNVGRRLDYAQDVLDAQVLADMENYMPIDTGNLRSQTNVLNASIRGYVYAYEDSIEYAHYQWNGKKYVDPDTGIAGFYLDGVGWRSRAGVEKVETNENLKYSEPNAHSDWLGYARKKHGKEWVKLVQRCFK